jgi:hypothetical protein
MAGNGYRRHRLDFQRRADSAHDLERVVKVVNTTFGIVTYFRREKWRFLMLRFIFVL